MSVLGKRRLPIHSHLSTEILEAESIQPLRPKYKGVHPTDIIVDGTLQLSETLIQWTRFWEAEKSPVIAESGTQIVDDGDASSKKALKRLSGAGSGLMWKTEDQFFLAGDYYVVFRLKVASKTSGTTVLLLRVYRSSKSTVTESLLTVQGSFGQNFVYVSNASLFAVNDIVQVKDNEASEINKVILVETAQNRIWLYQSLANDYELASNAKLVKLGGIDFEWNLEPNEFPESNKYHHFAFRMNLKENLEDIQFQGYFIGGITDVSLDWIGVCPGNTPMSYSDCTVGGSYTWAAVGSKTTGVTTQSTGSHTHLITIEQGTLGSPVYYSAAYDAFYSLAGPGSVVTIGAGTHYHPVSDPGHTNPFYDASHVNPFSDVKHEH